MKNRAIFTIVLLSFLLIGKNVDAKCIGIYPPFMSVYDATSTTLDSTTLNGEILYNQCVSTNITERGFEYGTSVSYGSTKSETGEFTLGTFSLNLTNLECGTAYHFRAFATDEFTNIGYSEDASFITSACPVVEKKKRVVSGSSATAIASFLAEQEVLKQQIANKESMNRFINSLSGQELKFGLVSDLVKELQIYLNNHGFILASFGPGSLGNETMYFGPRTKRALMLFQKANGLFVDGVLGPKTLEFIK